MHHWDAVSAAGGRLAIEPPVAADSIEEFLTFSVPTLAAYPEPARPALAGQFALRATDTGSAWTVRDDQMPGTVRYDRGAPPDLPAVTGTASDLLLWLYGRVIPDTGGVPADLLARFRALAEHRLTPPDRRPARPGSSRTTATPPRRDLRPATTAPDSSSRPHTPMTTGCAVWFSTNSQDCPAAPRRRAASTPAAAPGAAREPIPRRPPPRR